MIETDAAGAPRDVGGPTLTDDSEEATAPIAARARSRTLAALFAVAAFATGLGLALPVGTGSDSLGGFDVVIALSIVALVRHRHQRFPRSAMVTWALVLLILGVAMMVPLSPHWVVRSAGLVLVVQVLRMERFLNRPVILGFLAGAIGQVVIGLGGYAYARTVLESDDAFERLADYRALFDGLAGASEQPPLSASGLMRMQGLAGHPNELAVAVAIGSLLALHALRNHVLRWTVFGVLCLGTVLTLSRFAIVAVVVGVLLRPAGRTGAPGRVLAVLAVSGGVALSLNNAIRERLFDVRDEENARGRSAGPLDLLDDATFLPDTMVEVRHNSLAFMLDHAGLLLGTCWIVLLALGLYRVTRPTWTRAFSGTWLGVAFLFLTEDRIQSPLFLIVVTATAAAGFDLVLRARSDAGQRPSARGATTGVAAGRGG